MKALVAVAFATAALAASTTVALAQGDIVSPSRNAAGQVTCPGNYLLQGNVCVSISAGRQGGPDTVPVGSGGTCPSNFNLQGNQCVNIYAKRAPAAAPAGTAAGVPGGPKGGYDGGQRGGPPPRDGYREGNRDDRGYRRDDERGYRRDDDRDYRRGRDDHDRGPPRGRDDYDRGPPRSRTAVEPFLTPRGEWACPPNYTFRGNICVSAY